MLFRQSAACHRQSAVYRLLFVYMYSIFLATTTRSFYDNLSTFFYALLFGQLCLGSQLVDSVVGHF